MVVLFGNQLTIRMIVMVSNFRLGAHHAIHAENTDTDQRCQAELRGKNDSELFEGGYLSGHDFVMGQLVL